MFMPRPRGLSLRCCAGLVGAAVIICFPLGFLRSDRPMLGKDGDTRSTPAAKLSPARNPVQLHVLVEPGKLLGWVSGVADRAGAGVTIRMMGKAEKVQVEAGNTFIWNYSVTKETPAEIAVGDLKQLVTLRPNPKLPPSVFFVLDRQVFRPGQTMHFAGFLREVDSRGEFIPIAKKTVEVQLLSEKKKSAIKKWKITSDDFGQIGDEYTFSDADPLDEYALSIAGHRGTVRLGLAEYRKLTSQLNLSGSVEGGKLAIGFECVDFQGKPSPAEKIHVTTQIVSRPHRPDSGDFDPSEFVYATAPTVNQPRAEQLSEDEQLLARFHAGPIAIFGSPEMVVWENKTEKKINTGKGSGELLLDVPEKWRHGQFAAIVQAVLTDVSGRELRGVRSIPLDGTDSSLQLTLSKSSYAANENIQVKASVKGGDLKGAASLVVLRLLPPAPQPYYYVPGGIQGSMCGIAGGMGGTCTGFNFNPGGFNPGGFGSSFSGPHMGISGGMMGMQGYYMPAPPPTPTHPFPPIGSKPVVAKPIDYSASNMIDRKFVTASVFQGDSATLKLSDPGAYKLVVVWMHADGGKSQQEIGCIVNKPDELPGLKLQLDKETFEPNDKLTGTIRSGFADARVLLVLRDSSGFRLWKPIRLKNGTAEFREELPKDMRYGACVEVIYADRSTTEEPVHHASQFIRIVPRDRTIDIRATHKKNYEPGENVTVDLEINRKEAVDLIVSVFDRSLLDVHSGKPGNIRDFYLADDRVREMEARDLIRRKLGNLTAAHFVKRAEAVLATLPKESPDRPALTKLLSDLRGGKVSLDDLAVILRLAGFHARNVVSVPNHVPEIRLQPFNKQIADIFDETLNGWKIYISSYFDMIMLAGSHPTLHPLPYPVPVRSWTYCGGMQCMGGMMGMAGGNIFSSMQGGMMGMQGGMLGMGGFPSMGFGGGMGMGGMQGGFSHMPLIGPVAAPQQPDIIKVPGGLDTGEAWIRRDFSDLAHWNAQVRTDENGKARVEFKLPDSLTGWQLRVAAVSKQMHVGSTTSNLESRRPIMISPVLPRLFAEGDEVIVGAIVHNRSGAKQTLAVKLEVKNGKVLSPEEHKVEIAEGEQASVSWKFKAGEAGYTQLLLSATSPAGKDASLKRLPVVRAGAEQIVTWSGYAKGSAILQLPDGIKAADAKLELVFAPSLAADLVDTLGYLVDYPYGCVEQTMSKFLPAVKVAQVLKKKKIDNQILLQKLPACVEGGIKRLLELQQPDGGWAWQGNGQTHEMMTPYALYGMIEAEKAGYTIPRAEAIANGLARLKKYIDVMGPAQNADRLYCMYVYGLKKDLEAEWWKFIEDQVEGKLLTDYALALALEMAVRQVKIKLADKIAGQLRDRAVDDDGSVYWRSAGFSRWADDRFEVSAAVMKALVAHNKDNQLIPKVIAFFNKTKRGDRWNSTKDTAMIVFAMCDYLEKQGDDGPAGSKVVFRCNDSEPIEAEVVGQNESKKILVPAKFLKEGKNEIRFDKAPMGMMIRASLRFIRTGKDVAPLANGLQVRRQIFLLDQKGVTVREVKPGESVPKGSFLACSVHVVDPTNANMNFLLVESGVPAGAETMPLDDKRFAGYFGSPFALREMREGKVAFHHESAANFVIDRCVIHLEMAGDFVLPPARAELMYNTEKFGHSGTFALKVE